MGVKRKYLSGYNSASYPYCFFSMYSCDVGSKTLNRDHGDEKKSSKEKKQSSWPRRIRTFGFTKRFVIKTQPFRIFFLGIFFRDTRACSWRRYFLDNCTSAYLNDRVCSRGNFKHSILFAFVGIISGAFSIIKGVLSTNSWTLFRSWFCGNGVPFSTFYII